MRFLTILAACAATTSILLAERDSPFIRAPYVQLATDNAVHLVWRTDTPARPEVRFGTSSKSLNRRVTTDEIVLRRHPSAPAGGSSAPPLFKDTPEETHQWEARIDGLRPDTTYYYALFDGGRRLTPEDASYQFRTHPLPGTAKPVYFWVVGDSGTGGVPQARVHDAMLEYTRKQNRRIDLYLHVGDMAYQRGTTREFSDRFFAMYEPTLRHTVCWPAMGNHEGYTSKGKTGVGPYYDAYVCPTAGEAGGMPSGCEAYYSFDYGRVHFVVLDSHDLDRRPTGAMARWLMGDLAQAESDWLIAYFHHPPYSMGSHNSNKEDQLVEMREYIMPILEKGGVDMVFTGHSHIYERSMLVDGAYQTPTTSAGVILDDGDGDPAGDGAYRKSAGLNPRNGTVQVVTGHGGTGVSRKGTMPIMRRIFVEHGSVLIDITGDTLTGTMLNHGGEVRDTFAIRKRGTVKHTPLANPWQPEQWPPRRTPGTVRGPMREKLASTIIEKGATWAYLAGTHPSDDWAAPDFDDSAWKRGPAGFGYSDKDDRTELTDMKGNYKTVYLRRKFVIPQAADPARIARRLRLAVSYDDAFIAYLNGTEILRAGIDHGRGKDARGIKLHEAGAAFSVFPLKNAAKALRKGPNILAIEGHNAKLDSSDFSLHPVLGMTK